MRPLVRALAHANDTIRPPVVLLHVIKYDSRKMLRLARLLRAEGRTVYPLNFTPNWGQVGIETLAEQFKSNLDAILPADQTLDFVAFSMGGLVVRYYLQRLENNPSLLNSRGLTLAHRGG